MLRGILSHGATALMCLALAAALIALSWWASADGHAQEATPIPGGPDLTVDKGGPPPLYTPVPPLGSLTFVIVAHNLGDTAAGPVEVLDPYLGVPNGTTVQTTQGSCTLTPVDGWGVRMLCDLGTLDSQGGSGPSSATITVSGQAPYTTGRPPGLGVLMENTVTVDPENKIAETNEGNNTASVTYFLVEPLPTSTPTPKAGPVGGSVVFNDAVGGSAEQRGVTTDESGWAVAGAATLAGGLLAAAVAIAGVWHTRRRQSR